MKDLAGLAAKLQTELAMNRRDGINDDNMLDIQALCVAEEAGELVGAYRRYAGRARRSGTLAELAEEVADVLIATAVFAQRAGIDISEAIRSKLRVIYSRGWKDDEGKSL